GGMEAIASQMGNGRDASSSPNSKQELQPYQGSNTLKPNQVGETSLYGVPIVSLVIDGQERLCLAQISNTLLKNYSYNEIHNRRVALGITCVQCTPVQLEILRRAGAMPISSRRCGMITKREAERLCKSFLGENRPPKLPDNFAFDVSHECAWGCRGSFIPARYNSSRAKCIKCSYCSMYFSPNKFIFHSHRTPDAKYTQPDAANFNSWRRHLKLSDKTATEELSHAWEDVKAMFNGGTRKRTFSLQGAAAGGPGAGSPAAKAALHPPPPAGPELAPAHKSLRCSGQEPAGERGALGLPAAHGGATGGHGGAGAVRSYPVIPVPSKGFGMLQKLPPPLFPHPYGFPAAAFGLCPKKQEDALGGAGGGEAGKGGALPPGMFWGPPHPHPHQPAQPPHQPGAAKDTGVYPSFPVFWPAAGSLPVPPYPAQSQAKAAATAVVVAAAAAAAAAAAEPPGLPGRHGELEGSEPSGSGRSSATPQEGAGAEGERCPSALSRAAGEEERSGDEALLPPLPLPRKGSYLSAFRPVVKDAESIAKLYGTREAYGGAGPRGPGYLSPDFLSEGSSSYRSLSPGGDTAEEPEVDVESNRFPEDEEEDAVATAPAEGREPPPPRLLAGTEEPPPPSGADGPEEKTGEPAVQESGQNPDGSPERSSSTGAYEVRDRRERFCFRGGSPRGRRVYAPERGEHLQPLKTTVPLGAPLPYLCTPEAKEQDKEDNHSAAEDLETRKSYQDQRNVSHPSPVNTDRADDGLGMDVAGTQLVEKDIENLARDELQKLVLEQMELRKKLERDFQSLKGTGDTPHPSSCPAPGAVLTLPVPADNFQDQMKRELAYREEMVQQLQIVR
ncbi:SKOR1 protein, partial [Halcyon senegalensis]|nr:SKOR1 protein [Halcyon senegalensis]